MTLENVNNDLEKIHDAIRTLRDKGLTADEVIYLLNKMPEIKEEK